ncbi:hypothetical protein CAAN1_08S00496 [[Candida] anglica]|uniref:Uncharacterized protein n=1 Tax=[Candida] anglica TaxID=148631 RepID=A0ABP0EAK1_9ASCO
MQHNIFNIFILSLFLSATALAAPLKRFYQPSSPVFSLIAVHNGAQFQYNLVKFDGHELLLGADDKAFFGRIRANGGYILNIPKANASANATDSPSSDSVYVDKFNRLVSTSAPSNASQHFGIEKSLLSYQNSTKFLACPEVGYRGEYGVYFQGENKNSTSICPRNSTGYEITLLVQVDATVNYTPETNKNTLGGTLKRLLSRK